MADHLAVMNEGRIIQVGSPEEVYARPANLFCARFIGNAGTVSGTVRSVEKGRVYVETPVGMLGALPGPEPLKAGDAATLALRPEILHAASPGEQNAFPAEIVSRMYLGEMVQYQLRSGSVELMATALAGGELTAREGEKVRLAFHPDHAIAFASEGGQVE